MNIGILGAGQLGRMLALEGYPLGLDFTVLTESTPASATPMAHVLHGRFTHTDSLNSLAARCDVVTYESENIPAEAARHLVDHVPVRPGVKALETAQDWLFEKRLFEELGIDTVPFRPVDSEADLKDAVADIGLPAVLKTRRMGYDGKGQRFLRKASDVAGTWEELGGVPCILEGFCTFDREVSLVSVRGLRGEQRFYPLVENEHANAVLRRTWAPAPDTPPELQTLAEDITGRLHHALDYVGVLSVEFFQEGGVLRANEMAPRVHNSGHWTLDGAVTSQFENHLRAICGLPLGDTRPSAPVCMINLLGSTPESAEVLEIPNAHLHLYDKAPRPGRKLGHVTVLADDETTLMERVQAVEDLLEDTLPPR